MVRYNAVFFQSIHSNVEPFVLPTPHSAYQRSVGITAFISTYDGKLHLLFLTIFLRFLVAVYDGVILVQQRKPFVARYVGYTRQAGSEQVSLMLAFLGNQSVYMSRP